MRVPSAPTNVRCRQDPSGGASVTVPQLVPSAAKSDTVAAQPEAAVPVLTKAYALPPLTTVIGPVRAASQAGAGSSAVEPLRSTDWRCQARPPPARRSQPAAPG